ncbi:MAG: excinuclease ABC subunit UvrB [Chitinophagaceae bacterium]|nr:excinuclease ABC subunit UvrB [Chitinophagaceae bacterium]
MFMPFKLTSQYKPTGDQPEAIKQLVEGVNRGDKEQVLLGVTGSGKTFTIANMIQQVQKPTLVLSHNKTLVAQLYGEFRNFFPENAVEYFVSYYDYYQPEAYLPVSNTYIEKDLSINAEVEKLRLRATSSLMSGRKDIIVVASVSCIYGIGNPTEYTNGIIRLKAGEIRSRNSLLYQLVDSLYSRSDGEMKGGKFRVTGDTVDVFLPYADYAYRITFFGDVIEEIETLDPDTSRKIGKVDDAAIFPANMYITPKNQFNEIMNQIQDDMNLQVEYFKNIGKVVEATRLKERVTFDLEMMKELGYCSGIENYSRYLDHRNPGDRPFCLIDYFPKDFMMVIDESHATIPQVHGMFGGDRSRKQNLVEYGFRLPSAMDNRPLNYYEFENMINQVIYVSATPGDYELEQTEGTFVEQVVRPTGLLDPVIEVRPSINQVDDLLEMIDERVKQGDRVLVTTLTKRMAEELSKYMTRLNIRCRYIHSEVETLERVEILRDLRLGVFDVLIGVNLLREGLDLPEVSLVAIMDADKEGFLRNARSLTQIAGRAARNVNGLVIMYADQVTDSMQKTIDETNRRREKQLKYNEENNITPKTILRTREQIHQQSSVLLIRPIVEGAYVEPEEASLVADPVIEYMTKPQLEKVIQNTKKKMQKSAKELDFLEAARLRDEMFALEKMIKEKFGA